MENDFITLSEIFKHLGSKSGEMISYRFIPYNDANQLNTDESEAIYNGINEVIEEFKQTGLPMSYLQVFHNTRYCNKVGIYIVCGNKL